MLGRPWGRTLSALQAGVLADQATAGTQFDPLFEQIGSAEEEMSPLSPSIDVRRRYAVRRTDAARRHALITRVALWLVLGFAVILPIFLAMGG